MVLALSLGVLAVQAGPAAARSGTSVQPAALDPIDLGLSYVDEAACAIVRKPIRQAVTDLSRRYLRAGRLQTFVPMLVMASVKRGCPAFVREANDQVRELLRRQTAPPDLGSTLRDLDLLLADQNARRIAAGITVDRRPISAAYVLGVVDGTCSALSRGVSPTAPGQAISRGFPQAKLDLLGPMNGIVALAISRCRLGVLQANFLQQAMFGYLVANEFATRDVTPPVAWFQDLLRAPRTDGTAEVYFSWSGSDAGGSGIARSDLWLEFNGVWEPLVRGTARYTWKDVFRLGIRFRVAVSVVDRQGNRSAWSYSPLLTT